MIGRRKEPSGDEVTTENQKMEGQVEPFKCQVGIGTEIETWHFRNALFEDISRNAASSGKSVTVKSSGGSLSRQRYPCLACGEVKRWDQLTQHYKKFVQFDRLGIPSVPNERQMPEKVYQHTALFFEKNFSRDVMPTYKDHIMSESDCLSPTLSQSATCLPQLISSTHNLIPNMQNPLFFQPNFAFQFPILKSANSSEEKSRKTKPSSIPTCKAQAGSPSQSRRFYNCLGCGAAKRWDRLTDHYRKYVMFGAMGQPLPPSLDTMTPEQYVHTRVFREQGYSNHRMPQYRDHTEAAQATCQASGFSPETNTGHVLSSPTSYSQSHPNMDVFWENKHFADCKLVCKEGREVLTHRLVLAAHNAFFYQLLTSTASVDQDMAVIMMPDYSREDVVKMVGKLYNFKVKSSAFLLDENFHEYRITDADPTKKIKMRTRSCSFSKDIPLLKTTSRISNRSSEYLFDSLNENRPSNENHNRASSEELDISEITKFGDKRELMESLILKSGASELSPTYSCRVPGCLFSVKKSLLCIKGHILAEHWSNVS